MKNAGIIVVGGGLAGLAASLILADAGKKVALIEGQAATGGLWQTYTNEQGDVFTQGVRIPETTRIPKLDALLFGDLNTGGWEVYQTLLREGHVFNGTLNQQCGCIDTTLLPETAYHKGLVEMLAATGELNANYPHNKAQLDAYYGKTLTEQVFRPLMQKYTGQSLEKLAPHTHRILIPQRLKVGDNQLATELQQSTLYRQKVAHESWMDLGTTYAGRFAYPSKGESASWIDDMTKRATSIGVNVVTNARVNSIQTNNGNVVSVTTTDNNKQQKTLACDGLIWTLPSALLARAANIPYVGTPPSMRDLHLTYLTLNKPTDTDMFYMTDYDANRRMFRAVFLNNLTPHANQHNPPRVVIETYADPNDRDNTDALQQRVVEELCDTGVINGGIQGIMHQEHVVHRNIIPIYSPTQRAEVVTNTNFLTNQLNNIIISGRGSLNAFFAPQVFTEMYNAINERVNSPEGFASKPNTITPNHHAA